MKLVNFTKKYGEKTVFDRLSATFCEGEITCLLGASGVGKTTILNALAGFIEYGGEIQEKPAACAYVFQEPRLFPRLTVLENLTLIGAAKEDALVMLKNVGLGGRENDYPARLSGGEKQRVSLARAFLSNAPLVLLDEPFSSLDTALTIRLIELFVRLWKEKKEQNKTCVFVTHDLEEACMVADKVIVLKENEIALEERFTSEKPRKYGENSPQKERLLKELLN